MTEFIISAGTAVWLGILTSISPCPLATNIAAISYISRNVHKTFLSILTGLFYAFGRTLVYVVLGCILISGAQSVPSISMFLQQKMKIFMGGFLIIIGIILLDVIKFVFSGTSISLDMQKKLAKGGLWGAFLLGVVFALSFCPVSAALFFGSTFGLAMQHESRFIIPFLYGIGTAAPVVGFAIVVTYSAHAVGNIFHKIISYEKWARKISGIVFIGAGIYMVLTVNLHIF